MPLRGRLRDLEVWDYISRAICNDVRLLMSIIYNSEASVCDDALLCHSEDVVSNVLNIMYNVTVSNWNIVQARREKNGGPLGGSVQIFHFKKKYEIINGWPGSFSYNVFQVCRGSFVPLSSGLARLGLNVTVRFAYKLVEILRSPACYLFKFMYSLNYVQ